MDWKEWADTFLIGPGTALILVGLLILLRDRLRKGKKS
jgi:hypothetical protein